MYNDIRDKLVARGIPKDEVQFIHGKFEFVVATHINKDSEIPSVLSGINRIQRWSQSKPLYLAFLYFFASIYSIQSRGQGCHQE